VGKLWKGKGESQTQSARIKRTKREHGVVCGVQYGTRKTMVPAIGTPLKGAKQENGSQKGHKSTPGQKRLEGRHSSKGSNQGEEV